MDADTIGARLRAAGFPVFYVDREEVMTTGAGYVSPYDHNHHAAPAEGLSAYADLGSIARGEDTADQTDTVLRSNYRSLRRDYPDLWTDISYTNVDSLGAFLDDIAGLDEGDEAGQYVITRAEDLVNTLVKLREEYPLYDEDDHSALESEEITESWEQYVKSDLTREIYDHHADEGDAWDALSEDAQRDMFWQAVTDTEAYPEHSGLDVIWRYDAIVSDLARKLGVAVR